MQKFALNKRTALVLMGLGYFAWAWVSVTLSREPGNLAVLWFANAWGVGLLLCRPREDAFLLLVVQAVSNSFVSVLYKDPVLLLLAFSVCNALEVALSVYLLRRFTQLRRVLSDPTQILKALLLGAIVPAAVGATVGSLLLHLSGMAPINVVWLGWFMGVSYGYLGFASLFAFFLYHRDVLRPGVSNIHNLVVVALTLLATYFLLDYFSHPYALTMGILVLLMMWAGPFESALSILVLSVLMAKVKSMQWSASLAVGSNRDLLQDLLPAWAVLFVSCLLLGYINANKLTTKRLGDRERFIQSVTDGITGLVSYWDSNLRNRFANSAYLVWFGKTKASLNGIHLAELLGPELFDENKPYIEAALAGKKRAFPRTLIRPDGSVHHTWAEYIPDCEDGEVKGFVVLVTDITEVEEAKATAIKATQAKSMFLANMSHEIRTPMNAIMGLLNLLQSTELTSRQRDYTSKTESAAESLLGVLNDILDFSKIEAGKMELESEPFQIEKLMRSLGVVLSANVGAKNIEVLFDLDPTLPVVLRGDFMRLQQILINLGGNAVKFTAEGQVVISLRKLHQTEHTATIEFAVQDTGIGIAPEQQEYIFSGFSQAEGSTTRLFGGTGLGLNISRRFVQLMGGDIQITSRQGVGSTFSFILEFPTVEASNEPKAETQTESKQGAILTPRVLVVDDNPIAAELTLRMVRSYGWTADLAKSGKEAIERLSAQCVTATLEFPYPLIYMDWKLPDMDGWETTRKIREIAQRSELQQPIVIMLTGHGREVLSHRTEDEQELISDFLVKPVTASMLYEAWTEAQAEKRGIRNHMKGRSNTRQLTGMRILVVEDNLLNQQVAEELLSSQGAIVSLAGNGQLGVEAVAAAAPQFDVVLMDVQMPVLDGYGATRAIREHLRLIDLPIVAMTANAMASDRDACLESGMNEHIGKPFDMAKLVSLLIRITGFPTDVATSKIPADSYALPEPNPPVPEVDGLEIQTALNRMSGIRSLYVRTAKDFVKIMDSAVPELQLFLKVGDRYQAMMRLHTLKGNAGVLGATALAAQAATLEKLCSSDAGMTKCEAALAQFEVLVRDTQGKMREAITLLDTAPLVIKKASGEILTSDTVSERALKALQNIAKLTKASDLEVLQEFAKKRELVGEFPSDSVDALETALQNLDLDVAGKLCDQMLFRSSKENTVAG